MLGVGGCPDSVNLARMDRITIDGGTLVSSDADGNEEVVRRPE